MIDISKVTRFEVIDHTACDQCSGQGGTEDVWCDKCGGSGVKGRTVIFYDPDKQVYFELQDDGRTLKAFVHERHEDPDNS